MSGDSGIRNDRVTQAANAIAGALTGAGGRVAIVAQGVTPADFAQVKAELLRRGVRVSEQVHSGDGEISAVVERLGQTEVRA